MANEKFNTINTRIALRTGDYAYWTTGAGKDIELIRGEVCVCTVAAADNQATTAPTVLFKVCDTTGKKFADLKWTSALAADVYEWAKEAALYHTTEAVTTTDGTKTYVGNALTKVEWDATLNNGKGGLKFTKEVQFATKAELDAAIAAFGGDLSNIVDTDTRYNFSTEGDKLVVKKTLYTNNVAGTEETVGTYEFLTADEARDIADGLIGKANITIKGNNGLAGEDTFNVNATEAKTITLSHADTSDVASVTKEARKYVAGVTFDDYGHVTAVEMGEEVDQDLTHNHDEQYKKIQTTYTKELVGAQVIEKVEQNANGEVTITERTLTAADLGLASAMHFVGAYAEAPTKAFSGTTNERDLADGDVYLNTANHTEYVYSGGKWVELGNEGSHALKSVSITGTGYLTGGGTLEANRTIDIDSAVKTKIDNGATAYSWGDHSEAGYLKSSEYVVNSSTENGYVVATGGADNAGKVWKVGANGEPGWKDEELAAHGWGFDDKELRHENGGRVYVHAAGSHTTLSPNNLYLAYEGEGSTQYYHGGIIVNPEGGEKAYLSFPSASGTFALTSDIPSGTGSATIASVNDNVVTLKGAATLDGHTLANDDSAADITLAKVAKTGSIYDLNESSTTEDGINYLVLNCNW